MMEIKRMTTELQPSKCHLETCNNDTMRRSRKNYSFSIADVNST